MRNIFISLHGWLGKPGWEFRTGRAKQIMRICHLFRFMAWRLAELLFWQGRILNFLQEIIVLLAVQHFYLFIVLYTSCLNIISSIFSYFLGRTDGRFISTYWIIRLTYLEVCFSFELELNRLPYTNPADLTTRLLLDLIWRGRKDIDDLVCQAVGHCTSLSMREIINHNRLDSAGWSKYFIRIKVSKVEKPNKVTLLFPTYSQCSTTSQNDLK